LGCAVSDTTLAAAGRETGGEGESAPARPSLGRIRVRDANLCADGRAEAACRRQMPGPIRRLPAASQRTDGYPLAVRTDSGPEFTSRAFMVWAQSHGIRHPAYLDRARAACAERLNRKFQRQIPGRVPERAVVRDVDQARSAISTWRQDYNEVRSHSSVGRMPSARFAELHRQRAGDATRSSSATTKIH
jgi:transposase InsO family protein